MRLTPCSPPNAAPKARAPRGCPRGAKQARGRLARKPPRLTGTPRQTGTPRRTGKCAPSAAPTAKYGPSDGLHLPVRRAKEPSDGPHLPPDGRVTRQTAHLFAPRRLTCRPTAYSNPPDGSAVGRPTACWPVGRHIKRRRRLPKRRLAVELSRRRVPQTPFGGRTKSVGRLSNSFQTPSTHAQTPSSRPKGPPDGWRPPVGRAAEMSKRRRHARRGAARRRVVMLAQLP